MALTDKLTAIANAIRAKTGGTATMTLAEMPSEIASIQTGITPSGSVTLTEERSYDVTDKATAVVDMSATRANLAEAVTAKGVDTLPTSSFDTIATNIGLIESGGGELPPSYTRYEYIQSSGTQYIDTGIIPTDNIGLKIVCELTDGANDQILCGAGKSSTNDAFWGFSTNSFYYGWNNSTAPNGYSGYSSTIINFRYCSELNFLNSRCVKMWSRQKALSGTYNGTTATIALFSGHSVDAFILKSKARIYEAWISSGDSIIRHYVPAQRKVDGVLGLYDTVTSTFLTNAGTGDFTGNILT